MIAGLAGAAAPAWPVEERFGRGLLWRVTKHVTKEIFGPLHIVLQNANTNEAEFRMEVVSG